MKQELLILPQHPSSPPVVSGFLCVCFVDHCLSFCPFSFGHCVFCSSSIYGYTAIFWCITNCNQMKCNKIFLNFNVIFLFHMVGGLFCLFCLITYTDIYLHDLVPCCDKRNNFPDKNDFVYHCVYCSPFSFGLCIVCFDLCIACFDLCIVCFDLCIVCFDLCIACFGLCIVCFDLCIARFDLCIVCFDLCIACFGLCIVCFDLCIACFDLCIACFGLCIVCFDLCIVCFDLCIACFGFCIVCSSSINSF